MNHPYKIAGDILSAPPIHESGFSSVDLYGAAVQEQNEGNACSLVQLENESGTGNITVYQVFPGMELVYNDMHMEYCNRNQEPRSGVIEVNYCKEGRCECVFGEQSYCYMSSGDLSICSLQRRAHQSAFPTSHYHGITVTIDLAGITEEMKRILELLSVNLTRIVAHCNEELLQGYLWRADLCLFPHISPSNSGAPVEGRGTDGSRNCFKNRICKSE